MFRGPLRALLAMAGVLAVCGCTSLHVMSHMPLSTLRRLWSFDFAKLDPSEFRVAASLPDVLQPREVKVVITVTRGDGARKLELILVRAEGKAEIEPLLPYRKSGFALFVYRATAEDAARVAKMRDEMIALQRKSGSAGGGSAQIAVGVKACRTGDLLTRALPTTTLLRTDSNGYFVLLNSLDLRDVISASEFAKEVPPCT